MASHEIARADVEVEVDLFRVREQVRVAAEQLGADQADQVRLATATSEVLREILVQGGRATTTIAVDVDAATRWLVVQVATSDLHELTEEHGPPIGVAGARRLLDRLDVVDDGSTTTLQLVRRLDLVDPVDVAMVDRVRQAVRQALPPSPLDELRQHNSSLLDVLEELRANEVRLQRVNAELRETNQGVVALYTELSQELEKTNRGVVALYAELDDLTVQLRTASETKSRFMANASHELRTPIASILGLTRLLLDSGPGGVTDDAAHEVRFIRTAAEDLLHRVNTLLDLAKAEAGRIDLDVVEVDLSELLTTLRGTLRPLAPELVVLEMPEPVVATIETDGTILTTILRNLLSNALKHTEEGLVRLATELEPNGQWLRFVVTDTGVGIPREHLERVFEEFFQVRGVGRSSGGTGLGLPLVRTLTGALGGTVELASEVGRGTTVVVRIPVSRAPPAVQASARATAAVQLGLVLVVDDDPVFRHAVRGMLQGSVDRVIEADGVEQAIAVLAEHRPDLALLDVRLGTRSGSEVIQHLPQGTAVVVITSLEPSHAEVAPLAAAAHAVLEKATLHRDQLVEVAAVARQLGADRG